MTNPQVSCLHSGKSFDYHIKEGFDAVLHLDMSDKWNKEKYSILSSALSEASKVDPDVLTDPDKVRQVMINNNLADFSWDWIKKAAVFRTSDYIWFYLVVDNSVEAVCLLHHPKQSNFDKQSIYYIDYIACAYWNRTRPNYKRKFRELGTILIKHTLEYAHTTFGYRYGWSLHSVSTAEEYYKKLNMTPLGKDPAYENMEYFEASEEAAMSLIGVTL